MLQFLPLDPVLCRRAFSLDNSQLISEPVHKAISPSHQFINKCRVKGKIDGGHVIKLPRQVRFCVGSHSSAKQGALGETRGKDQKTMCEGSPHQVVRSGRAEVKEGPSSAGLSIGKA